MKSFRARVFIKFTLPVISIIVAGNVLLTWQISKYQKKLEEKEFLGIANTISTLIEIDHFDQLSSNTASSEERNFAGLERKLRKIMDDIQSLRSVFILVKKDERSFYVIAGASSKYESEQALLAGKSYPIENFPGSLMGFAVPFVLRDSSRFLTGYVPLRDAGGMPVAMLRLRFDPFNNLKFNRMVYFEILGITIFLILLSTLFGFFISHQIAVPVNNLVEGIDSIRSGNLDFRLKVEGDDEFGKLARTFNKMADSLNASRKILRGYLYRTVRSMVSILEARDPYTRGHSERVASFSEKIARKMGLSEKKIALLKETALLHDIGKLGIEENILNKIEPPTDQEWDIIKKHPSIGAEVLRPIFFEKDAIDIVIQHHERFDGKGYPYGLSGNEINILAQILSVADAFDAMTSARAYKEPMSKSEAARELKEKSGTQFNPDIVNAFLQILEDEMHHVLG